MVDPNVKPILVVNNVDAGFPGQMHQRPRHYETYPGSFYGRQSAMVPCGTCGQDTCLSGESLRAYFLGEHTPLCGACRRAKS